MVDKIGCSSFTVFFLMMTDGLVTWGSDFTSGICSNSRNEDMDSELRSRSKSMKSSKDEVLVLNAPFLDVGILAVIDPSPNTCWSVSKRLSGAKPRSMVRSKLSMGFIFLVVFV